MKIKKIITEDIKLFHRISLQINAFIIFIFQIMIWFINNLNSKQIYSEISMILFLLFIYNLFYFESTIILLIFPFILQSFYQSFGTYYLENNKILLYEIDRISYYKGSIPELILINIFFYFIFLLLFGQIKKEIKAKKIIEEFEKSKKSIMILLLILLIINSYFLFKGIINPFSKYNLDRFLYKQNFFTNTEKTLYNFTFYIVPILGFSIKYGKKYKVLSLINILIMLFYNFKFGVKYGEYLLIFYHLLFSFILTNKDKISNLIKIASLFFIVMLLGVFLHRKIKYNDNFSLFYNYLGNRLSQQGQLWWVSYDTKNKELPINFLVELKNDSEKNKIKGESGIYKIMKLNMSSKSFEDKVNDASSLTSSTKATLNLYFGLCGNLVFYSFLSIILSYYYKMLIYLYNNSFKLWLINIYLGNKFYLKLTTLNSMSSFYDLFSNTKNIVLVLIFILYFMIMKKMRIVNKRRENGKKIT